MNDFWGNYTNDAEANWAINCLLRDVEQLKKCVKELEEKLNERVSKNE